MLEHLLRSLLSIETAYAQNAAASGGNFGLNATAGAAGLVPSGGGPTTIADFIGNLIGTGLSFIGIVFFILMLYGGFLWMTARGNEDQTSKAIGTITAGAIGMVIIMASYTITSFLFTSLSPAQTPVNGVAPAGDRVEVNGCCVYRANGTDDGQMVPNQDACTSLCRDSGGQRDGCSFDSTVTTADQCG